MFEIKATEEKDKISTPMLSGSGKTVLFFGSLDASASPKISGGQFADSSRKIGSGSFSLYHQQGEVDFRHFPKSIHSMLLAQ